MYFLLVQIRPNRNECRVSERSGFVFSVFDLFPAESAECTQQLPTDVAVQLMLLLLQSQLHVMHSIRLNAIDNWLKQII